MTLFKFIGRTIKLLVLACFAAIVLGVVIMNMPAGSSSSDHTPVTTQPVTTPAEQPATPAEAKKPKPTDQPAVSKPAPAPTSTKVASDPKPSPDTMTYPTWATTPMDKAKYRAAQAQNAVFTLKGELQALEVNSENVKQYQTLADQLRMYEAVKDRPGITDLMTQVKAKIEALHVTPDDVEQYASSKAALASKIDDAERVLADENSKLDKLQAQHHTEAAAQQKQEREQLIGKQFSPWDGSHYGLTKVIKASMNNPKSYEHVETKYWDMGDYLVVRTEFRGTNAFGGVVKNWVKAKVDLDGKVLEIIEQGP